MPKQMLTERTECLLLTTPLPEGVKSFLVPDTAAIYDQEQQSLTASFKRLFGTTAAKGTFKAALDKENERTIYKPSVVAFQGAPAIQWGDEYFPIPDEAVFSGSSCTLMMKDGKEKYSIDARIRYIKKEDAKTELERDFVNCQPDEKADFLKECWDDGCIVELLGGMTMTVKLGELIGTHDVVGYRLNDKFGKYELELADGRFARTNSELHRKIESFVDLKVEVSRSAPARLAVRPSTKKTTQGHEIYPTSLVSFRNLDLPVFSFEQMGTKAKGAPEPETAGIPF